MSSLWKPRHIFSLGSSIRAQKKLATHIYTEAPPILQEMARIIAPITSNNDVNFSARYQRLAHQLAKAQPDSDAFLNLVKEVLHDAGTCGEEASSMCVLHDGNIENIDQEVFGSFLERRIALRFLLTHYLSLLNGGLYGRQMGIFERRLRLALLCRSASLQVQSLCMDLYGRAPEIQVDEVGFPAVEITSARQPLQYIITELLKNSADASVRCFNSATGGSNISPTNIPRIQVVVESKHDVTNVTVTDSAGGIPTGVNPFDMTSSHDEAREIAGFGVGLPISRMYARFFEGDLVLNPNERGTTATVSLPEFREDPHVSDDSSPTRFFLRHGTPVENHERRNALIQF